MDFFLTNADIIHSPSADEKKKERAARAKAAKLAAKRAEQIFKYVKCTVHPMKKGEAVYLLNILLTELTQLYKQYNSLAE